MKSSETQLVRGDVHFLRDVVRGLSRPVHHKSLPSRYLYDERGCELFEAICDTPEYYLTRVELEIMQRDAVSMAAVCGPGCRLVELGSGSSKKTQLLLEQLEQPALYAPVDVSPEYLVPSVRRLRERFPELAIQPICADFSESFAVPPTDESGATVVYFPGSTVGNFPETEAVSLLAGLRGHMGGAGGVLIGMDLKKSVDVLEAAYNDDAGVTAQFTLNLLQRIERELGADLDVDQFQHVARYNARLGRIEIYLRSLTDQRIVIDDQIFALQSDELINTEYSYKYDLNQVRHLAQQAGYGLTHAWLDAGNRFGVFFFQTCGI